MSSRFFHLLLLPGFCTIESALALDEPPPIIKFEAEMAQVLAKEGTLKVSLSSFYIRNELMPEFELDFDEAKKCKGSGIRETCGQRSYLYKYESVSGLITALDAGVRAFDDKKRWSTSFKLCKLQCDGIQESTAIVQPDRGVIALTISQTSSTTYTFSLDRERSIKLLNSLKYASKLQRFLAPQINAFNREKPDYSAGLTLEENP